jgi:hypothetical protein
MATTTYSCPECHAVLRPKRPFPPGKKAKCPECGTIFLPPAGPKAAASRPKPGAGGADDEDGEETYSFVEEKKEEPEDEVVDENDDFDDDEDQPRRKRKMTDKEKRMAVFDPIKDHKAKSKRGPAQAACIGPSNKLMAVGIAGSAGWLFFMLVISWPYIFPPDEPDPNAANQQRSGPPLAGGPAETDKDKAKAKPSESEVSLSKFMSVTLLIVGLLVGILGFAYGGLICAGAVKMQQLESYAWGITSCIMALFPIQVGGLSIMALYFVGFVMDLGLIPASLLVVLFSGLSMFVGASSLVVLRNPEVKAGFYEKME